MSVTSGGTAPNGLRAGGSASGSAGSAGIVITLSARQLPLSRLHRQTAAEHGERIRLLRGAVEDDQVGELLGRGADGVRGAPVEGRVYVMACGMPRFGFSSSRCPCGIDATLR